MLFALQHPYFLFRCHQLTWTLRWLFATNKCLNKTTISESIYLESIKMFSMNSLRFAIPVYELMSNYRTLKVVSCFQSMDKKNVFARKSQFTLRDIFPSKMPCPEHWAVFHRTNRKLIDDGIVIRKFATFNKSLKQIETNSSVGDSGDERRLFDVWLHCFCFHLVPVPYIVELNTNAMDLQIPNELMILNIALSSELFLRKSLWKYNRMYCIKKECFWASPHAHSTVWNLYSIRKHANFAIFYSHHSAKVNITPSEYFSSKAVLSLHSTDISP